MITPDLMEGPATGFVDFSHPEHASESADRLIGTAREIRAWQEGQRPPISDAGMVRQFPGLGSDKTYRKLRDGDVSSLNVDTHLAKYRGVLAQLEALAGSAAAEEIYEDLQPALDAGLAVAGLIPQRGMTRLVVIVGPTGSGKTQSGKLTAKKYPGSVVYLEAHEGWQSLNCALGELLLATGAVKSKEDLPSGAGVRLGLLVDHLKTGKKLIWIDEGHHCTGPVLNAIKTVLNKTDSLIVVSCIDTLWRKLAARSWEEVKQLFFNRLFELVKLAPPSREDAIAFFGRRVPSLGSGSDWHAAAAKVGTMAAGAGRFAFLREVARRANDIGAAGADLVTIATQLKASIEIR